MHIEIAIQVKQKNPGLMFLEGDYALDPHMNSIPRFLHLLRGLFLASGYLGDPV